MTVPIGYPEQFGALLKREPSELGRAAQSLVAKLPVVEVETRGGIRAPDVQTFADHVASFVSAVSESQTRSDEISEGFAAGHHNDIHGTMIADEQADISVRLLVNVRNRAIDLYREVMRMGS